jgi:hypothetical protein
MDAWPVSLQQKLDAESFELRYGNTLIRTDMEVGQAKVRSRYTDAVDQYTCSILLDFSEQATLRTFYKITLGNGALPFIFDDPFTEEPAVFRFIDPPSIRALGGRTFRVSMSWEKLS